MTLILGLFLRKPAWARTMVHLNTKERAFTQGDAAESVFYIQSGRIRLSVLAKTGKEATVALLSTGDFCGEECVALAQPDSRGQRERGWSVRAAQD